MLGYVTVGALDAAKSVEFYDALLGTLGCRRVFFENAWAGYGPADAEPFLFVCPPFDGQPARGGNGIMVGLAAKSRAEVKAAHAAGLAHGGSDEGAPGPRPPEGGPFYAAYVRDPAGNKLAIVFNEPKVVS